MHTKKAKSNILISVALLAVPGTLITAPVTAQESDTRGLEEIVVTAQRRSESLMEVPISMTAFTESSIENSMIVGVEDYFAQTPNINISDGATRSGNVTGSSHGMAIRGISNIGGNFSSYGFYLDEFNISKATLNPHLVDVERIEVLRGPQGTFYGRNASAGVISINTKKPTDEFEAHLSAEYSSFDTWDTTATVNLPVSDIFMLRGSVKIAQSDGYADNGHPVGGSNGYEHTFARLAARIAPSDSLTIDLNLMHTDEHTDDLGLIHTGVQRASISGFLCSVLIDQGSVPGCPFDTASGLYPDNRDTYYHNNPLQVDDEYLAFNTRVAWEGEAIGVTAVAGYISTDFHRSGDLDFSSLDQINEDFQDRDEESISLEVRVHSNSEGRFNWITGFLAARDEVEGIENINFGTDQVTNDFFGVFPHFRIEESTQDDTITSIAVFAEGSFDISDNLKLTLGTRWSRDKIDINETLVEFEGPRAFGGASETYDDLSPKFAINYALSDEVNFYGTISKGWKSGGFNLDLSNTNDPARTFDDETLWNYEAGVKTELLDNRLRLNLAVFHIKWEDIQVSTSRLIARPDGTLVSDSGVNNGAQATSQGFELELLAAPIDALELGLNIGYLDAQFDDYKGAVTTFNDADNPVDLSGQPLPKAPEWTTSANAQYNFPLFSGWEGFVRAEFSHVAEHYFDINGIHGGAVLGDNFPYQIPSRNVWNFRAGLENERFRIVAYVENAFDDEYYTANYDFGFLNGTGVVPSQQTYGLKFTASFD